MARIGCMTSLMNSNRLIGIKKRNNFCLDVTPGVATLFHYEHPEQMRNLTDFQIAEHALYTPHYPTQKTAEEFIREDEEVLRGKHLFIFEAKVLHNKLMFCLVHKIPYIPHKKIEGTCYEILLLPNLDAKGVASFTLNPNILLSEHTKKNLEVYKLIEEQPYTLTPRELECIDYLVKGRGVKEIAFELNLSKRTVDYYIRNIKTKLKVTKNTQIVAMAIEEKLV